MRAHQQCLDCSDIGTLGWPDDWKDRTCIADGALYGKAGLQRSKDIRLRLKGSVRARLISNVVLNRQSRLEVDNDVEVNLKARLQKTLNPSLGLEALDCSDPCFGLECLGCRHRFLLH